MAKMKRLLKKKSNLHWHVDFLQQYIRKNISPIGLRVQLFPSFQSHTQDFKKSWEKVLTQCSIELMKLLINQYQSELISLDQDILMLQSTNNSIKDHAHYVKRWHEVKDYITKITKDIISKKQNKMSKDKMVFLEGFAYRWSNPHQGRAPRNRGKANYVENDFGHTEEDTESNSSVSTSALSLQPPTRRGAPTSTNNTQGSRKQSHGGGYYTPYSKKRPSDGNSGSRNHTQEVLNTSDIGGGNSSQMKYMGAIAQQAAQILNIHPPSRNSSTSGQNPSQQTNSSNVSVPIPVVSGLHSQLPNFNTLPPPNPPHVVQTQMFTKQSTLYSHQTQAGPSPLNFHLPGPPPPPT